MTELQSKIDELKLKLNEVNQSKESLDSELAKLSLLYQPTMSELFSSLSEFTTTENKDTEHYSIEVVENGTYSPTGDPYKTVFGKVIKISHNIYLDANQKNIVSKYFRGISDFDSIQFIQL
jgi:hypothetical protein